MVGRENARCRTVVGAGGAQAPTDRDQDVQQLPYPMPAATGAWRWFATPGTRSVWIGSWLSSPWSTRHGTRSSGKPIRAHVGFCFLAYWLTAKPAVERRGKDQKIGVNSLLRNSGSPATQRLRPERKESRVVLDLLRGYEVPPPGRETRPTGGLKPGALTGRFRGKATRCRSARGTPQRPADSSVPRAG